MRKYLLTLTIALASLTSQAATTNILFGWDYPASQGTGFLFYELQGQTRVLLGGTVSNRFMVNNWTIGVGKTHTVVATNFWGASDDAVPYVVPNAPTKPLGLAPVAFNFPNVQLPVVLELSQDLTLWNDRFLVSSPAPIMSTLNFQLMQIPYQPLLFGRVKPVYVPSTPPIPLR